MKNLIGLSSVVLFSILIAVSCKKEDILPVFDPIALSGSWHGTSTIMKKGLCTFTDSIATVVQIWSVTASGAVTVSESGPGAGDWTGSVDKDRNFTITRTDETNCFGTLSTKSFTLAGKISQTTSGFSIHEKMDFSVCPPDCLFDKLYVLAK